MVSYAPTVPGLIILELTSKMATQEESVDKKYLTSCWDVHISFEINSHWLTDLSF